MKHKKITLEECLHSRAYSQEYYPIWRKPLSTLSFFILYFLLNFLKIKNAYIASFATVFFGIFGSVVLAFGFKYFAVFFLISSYLFDLVDGKIARIYASQNINAKFIDWIYHSITPSFAVLCAGVFVYSVTYNSVYLIISALFSIFFLHKLFLSFLFLQIQENILSSRGSLKRSFIDYESEIEKTYGSYKTKRVIFFMYNYFFRLFIDSTDIVFGLSFALIIGFEKIYLILLFLINFFLLIYSWYIKFISLYNLELNQHGKKN